jgi:hypothetical protein
MGVEDSPQFSQRVDCDPRAAHRDRRANRGIAHPCRDLARQTWLDLDVKDLTPRTPLSAMDANVLAMQRMPAIGHDYKLRSVC